MKQKNPETPEDVRVQTTAAIWGMATGMMALSIPLSAVAHTALIPLAVLASAATGTVAVWRFGAKNEAGSGNTTPALSKDATGDAAQKRIADLEERLANLETINNFERRLAEEALARHALASAAIPVGEVVKDEPSEPVTEEISRVAA